MTANHKSAKTAVRILAAIGAAAVGAGCARSSNDLGAEAVNVGQPASGWSHTGG